VGYRGPGDRAEAELNLELPLRGWLEAERSWMTRGCSSVLPKRRTRPTRPRSRSAPRSHFASTSYVTLQISMRTGASTSPRSTLRQGIHLRATRRKPQAGVQARGVRAVRRDGRGGEARVTKTLTAVEIRTREEVPQPTTASTSRTSGCSMPSTKDAVVGDATATRRSRSGDQEEGAARSCAIRRRSAATIPALRLGQEIQALHGKLT